MGVDISWQAFDNVEVERIWNEIPLGELISLLEEDKLFRQRKKDILPEEILNKQHRNIWSYKYAEEILKSIATAGHKDKSLFWIISNYLPETISQKSLLRLDDNFIQYFTYADCGGKLWTYCFATQAMYKTRGLQFDENILLQESINEQWSTIMRKIDVNILTTAILKQFNQPQFNSFSSEIE
ncbi:MAG: hypothetical protein ABIH42_03665, partial [Planctomycetota bacterium]